MARRSWCYSLASRSMWQSSYNTIYSIKKSRQSEKPLLIKKYPELIRKPLVSKDFDGMGAEKENPTFQCCPCWSGAVEWRGKEKRVAKQIVVLHHCSHIK